MLLPLCLLLVLIFFFGAIFVALYRKRFVRATFKGPFPFHLEFEADDDKRDSRR